jgi:A/G-specific adenine glycosylase
VAAHCRALAAGRVDELPVKAKAKAVPHKDLAAAMICRPDGKVLLVQRPTDGMLGGLWELPTVERRPRETARRALVRGLPALLGAEVGVGMALGEVRHGYSHFTIAVSVLSCGLPISVAPDGPQPLTWVDPAATEEPLHTATIKALALIDA